MPRVILPLLIIGSLAIAACGGSSSAPPATAPAFATSAAGLPTTYVTAGDHTITVEVAATPATRALGLGERDSLPADAGMLFDLDQPEVASFWMKGMRFALDMVWIDQGQTVVGVAENVQPQPGVPDSQLTIYRSPSNVRYVLELNAGAAARLGFSEGSHVSFVPPAAAATPSST